jgi:hypothetical protein
MLVVAHQTYSWPEAEAVTAMLNAYGLEAILADRHTVSNNWHFATGLGGFRVMVPEQHDAAAKELVSDFKAVGEGSATPESDLFRERVVKNGFGLFAFWYFLGLLVPFWLRKRK